MATIEKKIWPEFFDLVLSGKKKFELRLADFNIKEGDNFILKEWDPRKEEYTGRQIERKVDYVRLFFLDEFKQKKEIEEKGLYVIQFE